MAVGKSTIGRELAEHLGREFWDSDEAIETQYSRTGAAIASDIGVAALHALELEVFESAAEHENPIVLAPAESVVDREAGRAILAAHHTVWLRADEEILIARRARGGQHRRPMSDGESLRRRRTREAHLGELCRGVVDTGTMTVAESIDAAVSIVG